MNEMRPDPNPFDETRDDVNAEALGAPAPVVPTRRRMALSPLNERRWRNFRRNSRAFWSLIIFGVLFGLSLLAEFIANDKPLLVSYRGELHVPVLRFYPETAFGGDFQTEAVYSDIELRCLVATGGLEACFDDPEGYIADAEDGVVDGQTDRAGLDALAAHPLFLQDDRAHPRRRALGARRQQLARHTTTPSATCSRA